MGKGSFFPPGETRNIRFNLHFRGTYSTRLFINLPYLKFDVDFFPVFSKLFLISYVCPDFLVFLLFYTQFTLISHVIVIVIFYKIYLPIFPLFSPLKIIFFSLTFWFCESGRTYRYPRYIYNYNKRYA